MNMSEAPINASMTTMTEALAVPAQAPVADACGVTCHQNEVPPFVEAELVRLYGNIYSSLREFRIAGALDAPTSTYVERRGQDISALFLYQRAKREARVLNEGIRIDGAALQRFVSHLFSTDRTLDLVRFHALQPDTRQLSFPHHRYNCLEDIVLSLPQNRVAYLDSLGNSTRNYIKRYLNKLKRSFPSLEHRIIAGDEIEERHVRELVRLNGARMAEKGKTAGVGAQEEQRILRLARECGLLSVLLIDGRVCAGTINYQVGDNYFLELIAHDPAYNEYRLGTLCCYLTICACIERGGAEYHFLWGRNDYKFRLLGVERGLDHLTVYRSHWHRLLHLGTVLDDVARSCRRKGQLWLHELQGRDDAAARLATSVMDALRKLRPARS